MYRENVEIAIKVKRQGRVPSKSDHLRRNVLMFYVLDNIVLLSSYSVS